MYGFFKTLSRIIGSSLFWRFEEAREERILRKLFNYDNILSCWEEKNSTVYEVSSHNSIDSENIIKNFNPDLIIRISGGILRKNIYNLAKIASINIHHGIAPKIRGIWSIPWAIVENRLEWIGATIHIIDDGIDTGSILKHITPQISPGDDATLLFYRSHIEAVDELKIIINKIGRGIDIYSFTKENMISKSCYRTAPGVTPWIKYLIMKRGLNSNSIIEKAIK